MRDLLGYDLDEFQKSAKMVIESGDDLLGMAPTGSGKTVLALMAVKLRAFDKGKRAILTTPIKALSNQKYAEFERWFPGRISLITGDIQSLATMPGGDGGSELLIMTSEILSGMLASSTEDPQHLRDVSVVVMDEVHYINDPERGSVWERSLSSLHPDIQIVSLSATLRSPERFCEWLSARTAHVGRKCQVVQRHDRHVPLHFGVYPQKRDFVELHCTSRKEGFKTADYEATWKSDGKSDGTRTIRDLVRTLERDDRLPAIVFAMSRNRCVEMAHGLYERNLLISPRPVQRDDEWDDLYGCRVEEHQDAASDVVRRQKEMYRTHLLPFAKDLEAVPGFDEFKDLLDRGIAYHHAGMLPILREYVEMLFQAKLLKIVCATESLGVGINMPARTVVFTQLDKPDGSRSGGHGSSKRMLRPDEFWQMAGRAGRRGMDVTGYVVYYPLGKPEPAMEVRELLLGALPAARSQFKIDAESVLSSNLIEGSLRNHENTRASAKIRETIAALPPPPPLDVASAILRKNALENKLSGMEDPITGFKLRLNPKQKKEALSELEAIKRSGVVTEDLSKVEIERANLEKEARALDDDIERARREQIDELIRGGFMESDGKLTVVGKVCAEMGSHGDGMTLQRGKAIYEGRLDSATTKEALVWLATGPEDDSGFFDALESWLSNKDIRDVCGTVGFSGLGTFVKGVLKIATLMDEARTALLGLERFETYNRFDGFRDAMFAGIVSNSSLYVKRS